MKSIKFLNWGKEEEDVYTSFQGKIPLLKNLVFTITDKCPSWCVYCYNAKNIPGAVDQQSLKMAKNELCEEEILRLIQAAIPLGLEGVQFSGGEPLIKADTILGVLKKLTENSDTRSIATTIYTNGYLITEVLAKKLARAGLTKARVSLGGPNYELHALERKDPGGLRAWDKIISSIKFLLDEKIEVGVLTPVTRTSASYLEAVTEFATILGVKSITFHNYIPSGIAEQDVAMLTAEEHFDVIDKIILIKRKYAHKINVIADYGLYEFLSPQWKLEDIYPAPCGRMRLGVHADGWISTCVCTSRRLANTRGTNFSLKEFWEKNQVLVELRNPVPQSICQHCTRWQICEGGCRSYGDNLGTSLPIACPAVRSYLREANGIISNDVGLMKKVLKQCYQE